MIPLLRYNQLYIFRVASTDFYVCFRGIPRHTGEL
nr:MAG TPA: hypothetical protein [Caudoviricetes sp.]